MHKHIAFFFILSASLTVAAQDGLIPEALRAFLEQDCASRLAANKAKFVHEERKTEQKKERVKTEYKEKIAKNDNNYVAYMLAACAVDILIACGVNSATDNRTLLPIAKIVIAGILPACIAGYTRLQQFDSKEAEHKTKKEKLIDIATWAGGTLLASVVSWHMLENYTHLRLVLFSTCTFIATLPIIYKKYATQTNIIESSRDKELANLDLKLNIRQTKIHNLEEQLAAISYVDQETKIRSLEEQIRALHEISQETKTREANIRDLEDRLALQRDRARENKVRNLEKQLAALRAAATS